MKNIYCIFSWNEYPLFEEYILAFSKNMEGYNFIISKRKDKVGSQFQRYFSGLLLFFWQFNNTPKMVKTDFNVYDISSRMTFGFFNFFRFRKRSFRFHEKQILYLESTGLKVDLIHVQVGLYGGITAYDIKAKYGIPYVITEHMGDVMFDDMISSKRYLNEYKTAYKNANQIVSVSRSLRKRINEFIRIETGEVISNLKNVYLPEKIGVIDRKPNWENKILIFTLAGLINDSKGIKELTSAIALLPDNVRSRVHVLIGGEGNHRSMFEQHAKEMGVSEYCTWLGQLRRMDVLAYHRLVDFFVLASHSETFGMVLLEALFAGKPVISTFCGGPEDIVNEGNGLLVPVLDIYSLRDAINEMIINRDKYDTEWIANDAVSRFSGKAIADKYSKLFNKILVN